MTSTRLSGIVWGINDSIIWNLWQMKKTQSLALFNLFFALFIIVWGAWVRLSGSGAGCGDHWPLCNGQVVPLSQSYQTLIEYTHRLTSGLFGLTILAQVFFAYRSSSKRALIRKASVWSLLFTVIEALIGAVLVKKGLVVNDASSARAFVVALHLVNTFFLLSALTASLYFCQERSHSFFRPKRKELLFIAFSILLFLMVGGSGAIAALGNTLFPEPDLLTGMRNDFSSSVPFLVRLRIYHPIMAVALVFVLLKLSWKWKLKLHSRALKMVKALISIAIIALSFGFINWLLMAPTWGALLHLVLADILWIVFNTCILYRLYPSDSYKS